MWIAPSREILDTSQDKHGDKMNDFTMVLQVKLEAGNLGRGSHTSSRLVSDVTDWKVVGQPVRYASFD